MLRQWALTAALGAGGCLFVAGCGSPTTPATAKPDDTKKGSAKIVDAPTTKSAEPVKQGTANPADPAAALAKLRTDATAEFDKALEPASAAVKALEGEKAKDGSPIEKAKAEEKYLNAAGDLAEIRKLYAADALAKADTGDKLSAIREQVKAKLAAFQQKYPPTVAPPPAK